MWVPKSPEMSSLAERVGGVGEALSPPLHGLGGDCDVRHVSPLLSLAVLLLAGQ
jgi:hypothetical protein